MRAGLTVLALLTACAPYEDYWPELERYPVITGMFPEVQAGLAGGTLVEIRGARLGTTRTVVFGSRNAIIVDKGTDFVVVRTPHMVAGAGAVDVSVITDHGWFTRESGYSYQPPASEFTANEWSSAAFMRYDCPIEAWGTLPSGELANLYWCGGEAGYPSGYGYTGSSPQPGFAGDLQEVVELSSLPELGDVRFFGPGDDRPLALPTSFAAHAATDVITLTSGRDLAWDLAYIEDRLQLARDTYYWGFAIDSVSGPELTFFDDDSCLLGDPVPAGDIGRLADVFPDAEVPLEATGAWLGFTWFEVYVDGFEDQVSAVTATFDIEPTSPGLVAGATGTYLRYDEFSGYFVSAGISGIEGSSNWVPDIDYDVVITNRGTTNALGRVQGGPELDLLEPPLLRGDLVFRRDQPLTLRWTPLEVSEDPLVLAVELRITDESVRSPNGSAEVYRVTLQGDPAAGEVTIPAEVLSKLPAVSNGFDRNYDQVGYWAELSIAVHQLRKLELPESTEDNPRDLVVDFQHVINSPVRLR